MDFANSECPPLKLVALSENIDVGVPRRAMKRLNVFINVSLSKSSKVSMWIALTLKHTNMHRYLF